MTIYTVVCQKNTGPLQTWGNRNVISNRLQLFTLFSVIVIDYKPKLSSVIVIVINYIAADYIIQWITFNIAFKTNLHDY